MLDRDAVPMLSPLFRLQWEEVQQCHVLLYPEGMVRLNASAAEIMKRVDGKSTTGEIIRSLSELFDEPDLGNDVAEFITEAERNGWIQLG